MTRIAMIELFIIVTCVFDNLIILWYYMCCIIIILQLWYRKERAGRIIMRMRIEIDIILSGLNFWVTISVEKNLNWWKICKKQFFFFFKCIFARLSISKWSIKNDSKKKKKFGKWIFWSKIIGVHLLYFVPRRIFLLQIKSLRNTCP